MTKKIDKLYDENLVVKPWGYEYVVYRNKNKLSVTLLNINYKKKTSLHCHPNKKSGFIMIKGKALFQLGLWKKRSEIKAAPSKRMIARGLFHQIESLSKEGIIALEFETPVDKKDLVRFQDDYGRQQKSYEGAKYTKKINSKFLKFKIPPSEKKITYSIYGVKLLIENHKNFKKINKCKNDTIFAILDGEIVDNNNKAVLSCGDIVKTNDLKVLSKVFKIKKLLTLLKVTK
ncbi:cupin domain-containing protein [Candidatus Pelagibacter communis]|uniref:cupin domain-containing protein n=1 Tax=Pelagibacter ubique TaxID=198252 RepID=UPI00065B3BCB|nr:hypothetical protein [Candidatus Pelagibacter ubique]